MTKKDAIEFHNELVKASTIPGKKFAYSVSKNLKTIQDKVIKGIETLNKNDAKYDEYNKARIDLCIRFAKKENGIPVIKQHTDGHREYHIEDDRKAAFEKESAKLKFGYGSAIKGRDNQNKNIEKSLEEEVEFDIHMVSYDELPDKINAQQIQALSVMILSEVN